MPTLNWIGKDAVVKHHKDVPFRLLEPVPALSLPSPSGRGVGGEGDYSGNLIVQGVDRSGPRRSVLATPSAALWLLNTHSAPPR